MTITCIRRIEFDAAHRVLEHGSKCKYLHGHRYVIEATFTAEKLDSLGMVIDFGEIRRILGEWIDNNWDHNAVLSVKDRALGSEIAKITNQQIYYIENNPTAENMADYLHKVICPQLFAGKNVDCIKVKLWETPNCSVEAF